VTPGAAGDATQSDRNGTYPWLGHSGVQVGKSAYDLSNLTQLIKGQEKNKTCESDDSWQHKMQISPSNRPFQIRL